MNRPSPCSVRVLPDPRRKQAVVRCDLPARAIATLQVDDAACEISRDGDAFIVTFVEARYWSPDDPHLYQATLNVECEGGETQTLTFPIGLRQFDIGENRFRVNQRPMPLRGAALRAGQPVDGGAIERLTKLGFNALRIPETQLDESLLNQTDASGLLVFADLTDASSDVAHLLNHPSLVAWHVRLANAQATFDESIAAIRERDSSRLIVVDALDSQGFPCECVAVNPNQTEAVALQWARIPALSPTSLTTLDAARGFGADDRPTLAEIVLPTNGADGNCDASADDIVRNIRMNERVAGYWVDVAVLPEDCPPSTSARSVHQPDRPIVEMKQRGLLPNQETAVRVTMANDSGVSGRGEISLQVVGPTGQVLWKKKRGAAIPKAGKELWQGNVGASSKPGLHRFVVRIMKDRRVLAEDDVPFHVLAAQEASAVRVHIVGGGSTPATLSNVTEEPNAPVYVIPPLANTIWAYPHEAVCAVLANVQDGAVAIVLSPPADWGELTQCFESVPTVAVSQSSFACAPIAYHTARHPILEGVRTSDVMESSFQSLRRNAMLLGESDDAICAGTLGAFGDTHPSPKHPDEPVNDILVRSWGEGRLIFVNCNPLASIGDPASDNLLRNLVEYAQRRAVLGKKPPPFQSAINLWRQRAQSLMQWHVLGPLRMDASLPAPPAHPDDIQGEHDGAYRPVAWSSWWCRYGDECSVDLAEACQDETASMFGNAGLLGYAAHTFRTSARESQSIGVISPTPSRVWFNGKLLGSTAEQEDGTLAVEATTREGVNTVAIEITGSDRDWSFQFSMNAD